MLVCLIYLVWILKKGVLCIRLKHGKTGQTCFEEFAKDKKKRKKSPSHSPSLCAAAAAARHGSSEQRCDFIFRITAASLNVTRRLWIRLSSSKTAHPAACCANPGRKVVQRMWAMGKNSDAITKLLITHSCPCCSTLAGILGARATSQSPVRHLWITACRQKLF